MSKVKKIALLLLLIAVLMVVASVAGFVYTIIVKDTIRIFSMGICIIGSGAICFKNYKAFKNAQ